MKDITTILTMVPLFCSSLLASGNIMATLESYENHSKEYRNATTKEQKDSIRLVMLEEVKILEAYRQELLATQKATASANNMGQGLLNNNLTSQATLASPNTSNGNIVSGSNIFQ